MAETTSKSPLWSTIDKIKERLDAIEAAIEAKFNTPNVLPTNVLPSIPQTQTVPRDFPIPPDYVEAVDFTLNKSFSIKLEPFKDSPSFLFTIVVPPRYSTLTPAQREMNVEDIRPKVITYAEGTIGVREWAERVFKNFNLDMQKLIIEDRPFASRPV